MSPPTKTKQSSILKIQKSAVTPRKLAKAEIQSIIFNPGQLAGNAEGKSSRLNDITSAVSDL